MKTTVKAIICAVATFFLATSCTEFLTEHPENFLSPDDYYHNQNQMQSGVNGMYGNLTNIFSGLVAPNHTPYLLYELVTGYHDRTHAFNSQTLGLTLPILEDNDLLNFVWGYYSGINNCNSVIAGIENSDAEVDEKVKSKFLGEAYTLRAYYYFQLVRTFGPVPLQLEPTTGTANIVMEPSAEADVYAQIVSDLKHACELFDAAGGTWHAGDGHLDKGAAKGILAKVYLTMAGYPVKDSSCYKLAYDTANEIVNSGKFSLLGSVKDLRDQAYENSSEYLFSIQFEAENRGSGVHTCLLPYPISNNISQNNEMGGAIVPLKQFVATFDENDLRAQESGFFFNSYPALDNSGDVDFGRPFTCKFFDAEAAQSGKSGEDFPLLRYADVLLILAEAAMNGAGQTSDAAAINAYYQVRHRAVPTEAKPSQITFDQVFKERTWELCFEAQSWFDITRTHKCLDIIGNKVVDAIGFKTIMHEQAFSEKDMTFPYPLNEVRLNSNLVN